MNEPRCFCGRRRRGERQEKARSVPSPFLASEGKIYRTTTRDGETHLRLSAALSLPTFLAFFVIVASRELLAVARGPSPRRGSAPRRRRAHAFCPWSAENRTRPETEACARLRRNAARSSSDTRAKASSEYRRRNSSLAARSRRRSARSRVKADVKVGNPSSCFFAVGEGGGVHTLRWYRPSQRKKLAPGRGRRSSLLSSPARTRSAR